MKIKVKVVYRDKVEPTQTLEVDTDTEGSKESLFSTSKDTIDKILEEDSSITGIFISRE